VSMPICKAGAVIPSNGRATGFYCIIGLIEIRKIIPLFHFFHRRVF